MSEQVTDLRSHKQRLARQLRDKEEEVEAMSQKVEGLRLEVRKAEKAKKEVREAPGLLWPCFSASLSRQSLCLWFVSMVMSHFSPAFESHDLQSRSVRLKMSPGHLVSRVLPSTVPSPGTASPVCLALTSCAGVPCGGL